MREREGIPENAAHCIGSWFVGENEPDLIPDLPRWAEDRGLTAVIWTAVGPKFGDQGQRPSVHDVLDYLEGLSGTQRDDAERYIRCAPRQIDTAYRRKVEATLGWTSLAPEAWRRGGPD